MVLFLLRKEIKSAFFSSPKINHFPDFIYKKTTTGNNNEKKEISIHKRIL